MRIGDDAVAKIIRDPSWFVEDYDLRAQAFSLVRADRRVVASQPFLDHRWDRSALERVKLPLASVTATIEERAPQPDLHFIWHTSFCCSTLIAEALDAPGQSLSLREPLALVSVADAKRTGARMKEPQPARLAELAFRLLARSSGEQLIVKPSNFANTLAEDGARLSRGKALFLHSDLETFLISLEKGGDPSRKYARRLFSSIAGDSGAILPRPVQEIFLMSDLEIAALAWHMQMAHFRRMASLLGPTRAAFLDCATFLADPAATLSALDRFFALELGKKHLVDAVVGPLLKRHAKDPRYPFDPRQRQMESDDVRKRLGPHLQRIVDRSYRLCPDSPQCNPLPGTLAR